MRKIFFLLVLICFYRLVPAQEPVNRSIRITVVNEQDHILPGSTVLLLNRDSSVIRSSPSDVSGVIVFTGLPAGHYRVKASLAGHEDGYSTVIDLEKNITLSVSIQLKRSNVLLTDVTIVSKKPLIQFLPDKTVINPDASISNAGATVMDVLEKSPGITVSKDGSIVMKGKPSVMVGLPSND